ncbi:MAG: hypothetical protein GF365_01690 [Candidatus Buchananbacteria bacterium]|nr:hypothetical protein [Candidatus Buchananbacteria bacterium]
MSAFTKDLSFLELFIINTVAYFDVFDYPLTLLEIYNYLYTGGMSGADYSLPEIKDNLENNPKLKKIITSQSGFYFLKNRRQIIQTRLQQYNIADKKFKIALKAVKFLKFFPFIKLVAVCNNLAYFNARKQSDVDLFIITSKNRLYFSRFFITLLLSLMGIRRHGHKVTDRLCLSFYLTEDNLDLNQIKIVPDDIYLIYWLATLSPVYERDDFHNQFLQANNWFKQYLPNYQDKQVGHRYQVEDTKFSESIYKFKQLIWQGVLGNWLEKISKYIQHKKMSQSKRDISVREKNWVIINDQMLKFHENDRRLYYLQKFEAKRKELIEQL